MILRPTVDPRVQVMFFVTIGISIISFINEQLIGSNKRFYIYIMTDDVHDG